MRNYDQDPFLRLLNKHTQERWCAIPTSTLLQGQAAVCVAPASKPHQLTPSTVYVPQAQPHTLSPSQLLNKLRKNKKKILQVVPTFKYNLSGISVKIHQFIPLGGGGVMLIEGELGLNGSLTIKPNGSLSPFTLTTHDLKRLDLSAKRAADNFVQSIKVKRCSAGGAPTFSLGTSLSDPVTMTSTSVRISIKGPTTSSISASYSPASPYKIQSDKFNCTLAVLMSYLFNGTITLLPASTSTSTSTASSHQLSTTQDIIIGGGIILGGIILTVFTGGTDLLVAGSLTAGMAATA